VFNQQVIDTTVIARDGETVAIGGLITRSDLKSENKIPLVGDLPLVGSLFRYRTQIKSKRELLVILHAAHCPQSLEGRAHWPRKVGGWTGCWAMCVKTRASRRARSADAEGQDEKAAFRLICVR